MKKNATRYCAGPAYYRMYHQTFTVQNKLAAVAPKETITHHFFVSELGERNCRCSQNFSENVVKTETQQTFVNGLLGFITLGTHTPLEACVLLTHCTSCPPIWANSIRTAH